MSVPEILTDLRVSISVDGQSLKQYDSEESDESHVVRYVEAISGSNFTVEVDIPQYYNDDNDLDYDVDVDGQSAARRCVDRKHWRYSEHHSTVKGFLRRNQTKTTLQRFQFASLERLEDPAPTAKALNPSDLGEIKVSFWRSTIGKLSENYDSQEHFASDLSAVPEKILKGKALSAIVKPGPIEASNPVDRFTTKRHDDSPYMTFSYLYRTKHDLQILGLIPRSQSPRSSIIEGTEIMTPSQLRAELRKKARELQVKNELVTKLKKEGTTIKRERSGTVPAETDNDELSFVSANPVKRRKVDTDAQIIDLT